MKKYLILILLIIFIPNIVDAKSYNCNYNNGFIRDIIEIDKDKLYLDESATISVHSNVDVKSINYKISNQNIISVNNNGIVKALNKGNSTIIATIILKEDNEECIAEIPITVEEKEVYLDSLNIKEYDISNIFNKDVLEYNIDVSYSMSKITIEGTSDNEINGLGEKSLIVGMNTFLIGVGSGDNSKTYKLNITRGNPNNDASLKELLVEGYLLTPRFNKDTLKYTLNVDKDVNDITIKATANYQGTTIKGDGTYKLASGTNKFFVVTTAEDGSNISYEIEINKIKGDSKLSKLVIKDYDINFDSDQYIYYLNVTDIDKLDLDVEVIDNDNIEIIGNENLKEGNNSIIIKVTGNDKMSTTYKLEVNKVVTESILKNNKLVGVLLIIFVVSIIIMISCIIIFIKRNMSMRKIKNLKKKIKNKKVA